MCPRTASTIRRVIENRQADLVSREQSGAAWQTTGVFLSNRPVDSNEGATGDAVLVIQFNVPFEQLSDLSG
jgi:hypothetical protein